MPERFRARRALPCTGQGVIDDAYLVLADNGLDVLACGRFADLAPHLDSPATDLGEVTLVPGVINAHTHLELSHTAGRTCLGQGFHAWVQSLIRLDLDNLPAETLEAAIDQLQTAGTAHVVDIASRNADMVAAALDKSGVGRTTLIESIGSVRRKTEFDDPARSLAGHALYSTDPDLLQETKAAAQRLGRVFSMHLAEHPDEVETLATGRGEFAALVRERLLPEGWMPPGLSPVALADKLGLLDEHTLAVHCVHISPAEARLLAERRCGVCLCPRSNDAIGAGRAPVEALIQAGARICLGTDGLSSNEDLNVWGEAVHLAGQMDLTLWRVLDWLCRTPAEALGIWPKVGCLAPGARGGFSLLPPELEQLPTGEERS